MSGETVRVGKRSTHQVTSLSQVTLATDNAIYLTFLAYPLTDVYNLAASLTIDSRRRQRERPQEHVASRLEPGEDAVETQEAGGGKAVVCAGRVCKQHVRHHPDRHRLQKGSDAVSRVDRAHAPDEGSDGPESEHPLEPAQRVREERWQVVAEPEAVERPLGGEKYQAQPRCRLRQIQSRLSYLRRHPESRERVDQRGGPQAKRLKIVRPERPGLQVLLQLLQ
mmetsp:Transcript_29504/g.94404  ORF Transcript_29504/g.94404 Transcript_29504/m.94404 type:complete len:223 (-) Transcript_29504:1058-1726(-)